jgi:hypothetical protein
LIESAFAARSVPPFLALGFASLRLHLCRIRFPGCETSFRMGIMNVGGVDNKNTYVSQSVSERVQSSLHAQRPQPLRARARVVIAHGGRARVIEPDR